MVDLDEIRKRWGDSKKGSQYYADVHALMDEVKRLRELIFTACVSSKNDSFRKLVRETVEDSKEILKGLEK